MTSTANGMALFNTDPALQVQSSRRYLVWAILGFGFYLACVIGGSMLQSALKLGLTMGWGQQILSALAVLVLAMFLKNWKSILAWRRPEPSWVRWSILSGLAIAVVGLVVGLAIGDQPQRHGIEYFVYEATMPGLAEELGFRGLLFGCLLAAFGSRPRTPFVIWIAAILQAVPFAALHGLEASGFRLLGLFCYTAFAGVVLAMVRLKTGSILPAIVGHNIANVAGGLIDMVLLF